jgi:ribonuclease BN (tRNA processing enzyme)
VAQENQKLHSAAINTITFLGTGGARFMIISQELSSGGLWFNLEGTEFMVDPGPGAIVRATAKKFNPENLDAIIVSHRHIDHAHDVNIMAEAMTRGGFRQHGRLFAPREALEDEPIILSYLRKRLESVETLAAGKTFTLDNFTFSTPVRHIHGAENYGMVFKTKKYTIAYITDTRYFSDLSKYYKGDLLLLNVVFVRPFTEEEARANNMPIDHLSVPDVERLANEIRPKMVIMTHFGMGIWRANPSLIAEQLTEKTGIKIIAARDGMTFNLSELNGV